MSSLCSSSHRSGWRLCPAAGLALLVLVACDSSGPGTESVQVVTYDRPFTATYVHERFSTDHPAERTTQEQEIDGLRFSVTTVEVPDVPPEFPVMHRTEVVVTNLRDTSLTLPGRFCGLTIEAHRDPQRTGQPVSQSTLNEEWCDSPINPNREVSVAPGASHTYESAPQLFGEEDGRYFLSVRVNTGGSTTVVIAAGSVDWYWTHPNLAYHVTLRRERGDPDTLEATLAIENLNGTPVYITWGHWSYYVRAFANPQRSGSPLFSSRYPDLGCYDILNSGPPWCAADATVEPGQTHQFHGWRARFGADEVVPDSLSPGRFYFAIEFTQNMVNKRTFLFETGAADLP
jgi:hypothetical protein